MRAVSHRRRRQRERGASADESCVSQLIVRKECQFFYKQRPYSTNRRINDFCDSMLRYAEGDVFVVLGRVLNERIESLIEGGRRRYPEILALARTREE